MIVKFVTGRIKYQNLIFSVKAFLQYSLFLFPPYPSSIINRLQIIMQILIFINLIKEMECKWKLISSTKYFNK